MATKPHVLCRIQDALDAMNPKKTQAWLAEATKIRPSTLSRITAGLRNPRVTAARRIARQLGVSIDYLWPDSEPKRHK